MDYELAKKLKEAGFPEPKEWTNKYAYCLADNLEWAHTGCKNNLQLIHEDNDEGGLVGENYSHRFSENKWLYAPTLEELIEACGEGFCRLYKSKFDTRRKSIGEWVACDKYYGSGCKYWGDGSTPLEAVAHLWLALNKK